MPWPITVVSLFFALFKSWSSGSGHWAAEAWSGEFFVSLDLTVEKRRLV